MAGSRVHKLGTVFSRVQGLLRSGALKPDDKPLWYDIYEAFPPSIPPKYERRVSKHEPPNILYPEDLIRAKFYSTYVMPDIIDMKNREEKSVCQRFIEKYNELAAASENTSSCPSSVDESLFQQAAAALSADGVSLRSWEEINKAKEEAKRELMKKSDDPAVKVPPLITAQSLFEDTREDIEPEPLDREIHDVDETLDLEAIDRDIHEKSINSKQ